MSQNYYEDHSYSASLYISSSDYSGKIYTADHWLIIPVKYRRIVRKYKRTKERAEKRSIV